MSSSISQSSPASIAKTSAPPRPILQTDRLHHQFGGVVATSNVSLTIGENEIHALIGPNGAGKTTLISQLSGEIRAQAGRVLFQGEDVTALPVHQRVRRGMARSFQITSIFQQFTVLENVAVSYRARSGGGLNLFGSVRNDRQSYDIAKSLLEEIGLADRRDKLASALSHGEQRQLEVAMVLATGPELMLLDEPMAGMGIEESQKMVELLARMRSKASILLVEHDMDAVFSLADRISVLVYGELIATGSPEEIRGNERVQAAYLGEAEF